MTVEQLVSYVIPDPDECRREAERLRLENPELSPEALARQVVQSSRKWAAGLGAAAGAIALPITLVPAAVAEAAALLRIEGKMAGTIAALLDPQAMDDPDNLRRDTLFIIFPGVVSQVLRRMGIRAGERTTRALVQKYATRGVVNEVLQHVAKRLGVRLSGRALATKTVPLVGAGIGAVWNWVELEAIGKRALRYYGIEPPPRVSYRARSQQAIAKLWPLKGRLSDDRPDAPQ